MPLPDGNGLLIALDITDSQKAEDALRERNAALIEADHLKTRFLANMSYEFRTPLTSIGGFAEMLQMGLGGDLSDSGREYVEAILTSVTRLSGQIEPCWTSRRARRACCRWRVKASIFCPSSPLW
jgi:signal transduction histidine kinase